MNKNIRTSLDEVTEAPAMLTQTEMVAIDAAMTGDADGITRRVALASLTRAVPQLIESVTDDRVVAVEFARHADALKDYIDRLNEFTTMMQSARLRLRIALCARPDMDEILAEAGRPAAPLH